MKVPIASTQNPPGRFVVFRPVGRKPMRTVLLKLCLALTCLLAVAADEPATQLKIVLRKPQDKATLSIKDSRAVLAVESESGIGSAEITLAAGSWPKTIVLRLGVKDLEGFHAENGVLRIHTSLGHAKPEVSQRAEDGKWKEAPAEDRHRISVRRAGDKIEVELPAVLFSEGRPSIRVQWIDYYRG